MPDATDEMVELIAEAIVASCAHPSGRLRQQLLAERLGINNPPVTEGLFVVQAKGLVVSAPSRAAAARFYAAGKMLGPHALQVILEGRDFRVPHMPTSSGQVDVRRGKQSVASRSRA